MRESSSKAAGDEQTWAQLQEPLDTLDSFYWVFNSCMVLCCEFVNAAGPFAGEFVAAASSLFSS